MAHHVHARAGDLLLQHVRLSGAGATREPLEQALRAVTLPPLGDNGWLYIPRHRSRAILRPDGRRFARRVSVELSQAMASALIDPPVGAQADAYHFTSRAALAAWILGSWLATPGDGASRGLLAMLPGGDPLVWLRREVLDDGQTLPALGAALARQGLGARWLIRLQPADRRRMRLALLRSHGLPPTVVLLDKGHAGGIDGSKAVLRTLEGAANTARAAGNDISALPPPAVELLLILLQLQADPATPRAALAAAAARVANQPAIASAFTAEAPEPTVIESMVASAISADPPTRHTADRSPLRSEPFRGKTGPTPSLEEPTGTGIPHPPLLPVAPSPSASVAPPTTNAPAPNGTNIATNAAHTTLAAPDPTPTATTAFTTDFAGLWFLCNAFLALGLYGDFSHPGDDPLALAPSRLLDRLALQWFGARYRDDRLHRALTREGCDPPLPRRWRVEPPWLDAFTPEDGCPEAIRPHPWARWHPAGFPLRTAALSRRRGWHPSGRALEGRRHPAWARGKRWRPAAAPRPLSRIPSAQATRWLACLALYLDARIQRATGEAALGLSSLALPGRCRIGADRVEVELALAELPLPLRLAGLDRDPGWLPAEGRTIAFHFL